MRELLEEENGESVKEEVIDEATGELGIEKLILG